MDAAELEGRLLDKCERMSDSLPSSHFQIELHGQVLVIEFVSPRLYEYLVLNELDQELRAALSEYRPTHVVFDFRHVDFCSSSLISAMLMVRRKVRKRGGIVALSTLQPNIVDTFRVLCMDQRLLPQHEDTQAAIASLQQFDADDDTAADG